MYHSNNNCNDFTGNNEYTGKVWFNDNLNTGFSGGTCIQCNNNNSCNTYPDTNLGSRNNTCAETITVRLEGWEDDSGNRCNYDDPWYDDSDDCHCGPSNVGSINFRDNASGTISERYNLC